MQIKFSRLSNSKILRHDEILKAVGGTLMAFASSNLLLEGTCVSIDPEITINF